MSKPISPRALALIVCLVCAVSCWSQVLPGHAIPPNPLQYFLAATNNRTSVLTDMFQQNYGGSWEEHYKYSASYNEQGLCATFSVYVWSYDLSGWDKTQYYEFTYRPDNRFLHADSKEKVNGVWVPFLTVDWTYTENDLDQMSQMWYQNGELVDYLTTDFAYDMDTGRLDHITETFHALDPANPPMNRFAYEWDAQGRPVLVQKYQKRANDPAWEINIRELYTYLPEDQSTYAQHLRYLECRYSITSIQFSYGSIPFLIDENPILYSPDEGVQWNDYFLIDYTYNPELILIKQQRFLRFMGLNELVEEVRYTYENDLVSVQTWYEPMGDEDEMVPYTRLLYEYTDTTENDDPATPSPNIQLALYPNPFKHSATIQFDVAKTGMTVVSVHNLRGQKVRVLLDAAIEPGQHTIVWDGKDTRGNRMDPGIYFIRVAADGRSFARKAMLLE